MVVRRQSETDTQPRLFFTGFTQSQNLVRKSKEVNRVTFSSPSHISHLTPCELRCEIEHVCTYVAKKGTEFRTLTWLLACCDETLISLSSSTSPSLGHHTLHLRLENAVKRGLRRRPSRYIRFLIAEFNTGRRRRTEK